MRAQFEIKFIKNGKRSYLTIECQAFPPEPENGILYAWTEEHSVIDIDYCSTREQTRQFEKQLTDEEWAVINVECDIQANLQID